MTRFRANALHHREDRDAIDENEWKVFLQGSVMASMMSEEERHRFSGG